MEAAGSSGGNPSFLLLSACERKNIFMPQLLVFSTSVRNLKDKARKILKHEVEKLETLSSSNFWRIFSLALFSSSFSSLRNSIMLAMVEKKLVRSERMKIKQNHVQSHTERRKNQPFPFILFLNSFGFKKFFTNSYSFLKNVKNVSKSKLSFCLVCVLHDIACLNNSIKKELSKRSLMEKHVTWYRLK